MIYIFLIEGIVSNYLSSYILLTLISIIFLYKIKNVYSKVIFVGFLYDVIYTDTLFLNALLFPMVLFLIKKFYHNFEKNLFNTILLSLLILIFYLLISYSILILVGYLEFNFNILILNLKKTLVINEILVIFIYLILKSSNSILNKIKHIIK